MARLLRSSSFLKPLLGDPRVCRRGLLVPSSDICSFSTKGRKKKSESARRVPGDENLSSKDLNLKHAMQQIETSFGKGSIMWLGRGASPKEVPVVSTGSFALDIALGIGGFPKGRVVEIYGPEASGKTTLALHVIAEAQKHGGYCVFVDAEHAFDSSLAEKIGVNTQNLLLWQPDCSEQALGFVDTIIASGPVDVVVVDSVGALVPKIELEDEMGDSHMAMQARLMSQALRKFSHSLSLSQTILIFVNQVRPKLSSLGGPSEVTSGGNALKFFASIRLNMRRIGAVKKGEEVVGSQVIVEVVKNKHAPPFKTAEFELELGKGICRESELIELGIKHKFIQKNSSPSSYTFKQQRFCSKEDFKKYLNGNPEVKEDLKVKLREKLIAYSLDTGLDGDPDEELMEEVIPL